MTGLKKLPAAFYARMVLPHGFIKKSRKAPNADMDLAADRWKELAS